nr:eukaryotic translation initiation factor 5A-4 [Ipomoea batatas]
MSDEEHHFESKADAGASKTYPQQAGTIRKNGYIVIKSRPCKVVEVSTSKTGKHGHAKCHFVAIDIFNGKKLEDIVPSSHNCDVPHVNRTDYQLIDISEDGFVSLLTENGNTKDDLRLPTDEALLGQIRGGFDEGKDLILTVMSAMGEEQICAVKDIAKFNLMCMIIDSFPFEENGIMKESPYGFCLSCDGYKVYAVKEGKLMVAMISSKMSHLDDLARTQCELPEASDDLLLPMLMRLSRDLSSFKMVDDSSVVQTAEVTHLLDYLFESIMPKMEGYVKSAFAQVWAILSKLNRGPARALKRLSNPEDDEKSDSKDNVDKPPSIEEITIPSVTKLTNADVRFVPTNKGILNVEFETFTLYLPVVSLDINSELVLRVAAIYVRAKSPKCNDQRQDLETTHGVTQQYDSCNVCERHSYGVEDASQHVMYEYLSESESRATMTIAAVMITIELMIDALILFFTRRNPNNAEKTSDVDARRAAVEAGRSSGVGYIRRTKYIGTKISAIIGHPATATHEIIHLLFPPLAK